MNTLRLATEAEAESIKAQGDLGPSCTVIALDTDKGPILAVIRRPVEVDPVFFPEGTSNKTKYVFWRDVITGLKFQGNDALYFNILVEAEDMLKMARSLGAEDVSRGPEIRFKRIL